MNFYLSDPDIAVALHGLLDVFPDLILLFAAQVHKHCVAEVGSSNMAWDEALGIVFTHLLLLL